MKPSSGNRGFATLIVLVLLAIISTYVIANGVMLQQLRQQLKRIEQRQLKEAGRRETKQEGRPAVCRRRSELRMTPLQVGLSRLNDVQPLDQSEMPFVE